MLHAVFLPGAGYQLAVLSDQTPGRQPEIGSNYDRRSFPLIVRNLRDSGHRFLGRHDHRVCDAGA